MGKNADNDQMELKNTYVSTYIYKTRKRIEHSITFMLNMYLLKEYVIHKEYLFF